MAIGNGYATLAELKSRLDIHMADHDVNLEQMIESASRQIDGWTARTFYPETATRVVTADSTTELVLDRYQRRALEQQYAGGSSWMAG